ncbi:hypothetical protein [Tunturiibacter gelidiferens]|uniref:hypothetical protein n=1 Tax=Tunturiibacter gelidiferens TaxID=3069689 RepID=UPI003D9B627B
MPNRNLDPEELKHANALLSEIRERLIALAGDDPLLLFAYRRKVVKELGYDERSKVVFWEVKTVNDSRIRCRAELEEDKFPHVLKQLYNYRVFLEQDRHVEQVESAYRNAAKLLVKLRALADEIGPTLALGPSMIAARQAKKLAVAPLAALAVVDLQADPKGPAWISWKASHEGKLLGKIPMRVLEIPEPLVFAGAQ